jgi:hypothetical protein
MPPARDSSRRPSSRLRRILIALAVVGLIVTLCWVVGSWLWDDSIPYSDFLKLVEDGKVQ